MASGINRRPDHSLLAARARWKCESAESASRCKRDTSTSGSKITKQPMKEAKDNYSLTYNIYLPFSEYPKKIASAVAEDRPPRET